MGILRRFMTKKIDLFILSYCTHILHQKGFFSLTSIASLAIYYQLKGKWSKSGKKPTN